MFERRVLIDQATQTSDAATHRASLPRAGLLSGIELEVSIQNGSTAGEEHVIDAVDRVEVVADGSNVLFSLEGVELLRWAWYWSKRFPTQVWDERASAQRQQITLPILFGRWLGDTEFGLDLSRYRDVEIRVQYSPTIAATGFTTGTFRINEVMWIDDSGRSGGGRGFLRTTQVYAFTSAASGEEVVELAREYPLFDLLVYAREDAIDDGVDITQAEVRVNDRRIIPYTGRWNDIQGENQNMFGIDPTVSLRALRADNATIDLLTGRILAAQLLLVEDLAAAADFRYATIASYAGDRITTHIAIVEGSATYAATILETTRQALLIEAQGLGIGNAICIPFALGGNPDLALPSPEFNRVQLALTQGGAGGDVRVSTRELVAG